MLQECLVLNFISMMFEELFAGKCGEKHLLKKKCGYFASPSLASFCGDVLEMGI
jgi:hypothetical protein